MRTNASAGSSLFVVCLNKVKCHHLSRTSCAEASFQLIGLNDFALKCSKGVKGEICLTLSLWCSISNDFATYPNVVIVTMVYQKAAGIEVNVVPSTFFSA